MGNTVHGFEIERVISAHPRHVWAFISDSDRNDTCQILDSALAEGQLSAEEHRQRVLDEGMERRNKSPGVWIALAAGWSGGSMVAPDLPKVNPPIYLTARAVNAGVLGALARVDIKHRADTLNVFVEMGVSLASR